MVLAVIAVAAGLTLLPPVRNRLAWRVNDALIQVRNVFRPPSDITFLPTQQAAIEAIVNATMQAHATQEAGTRAAPAAGTPAGPTPRPALTPTPVPQEVTLPGVKYVDQRERWNYCAPANLTMALTYWGWQGTRDDVARVVKPGENDASKSFIDRGRTDRNVMPYELEAFVNENTEYRALYRHGGTIDLMKALVAAGFPPVAEKGYYEPDYRGKVGWLGHYQFITGYDETKQELIVQDTFNDGPNFHIPYETFLQGWRSFNFLFLVVYPADREAELLDVLGPYADATWASGQALQRANADIQALQGIDQFFAWFAKGTSHVALLQYVDAATAYDQAFAVYNTLGSDSNERPYRMMWYQTGPYWAYFYSGRYYDVVSLADTTLNNTGSTPTLEESLYWRGLAKYALGDTLGGIEDVRRSVYYNMNFTAGLAKLQEWGAIP